MVTESDQARLNILAAIRKVVYRAEQQVEEANYVRIVDFDKLSAGNSEILYGRNGTGKTHLLRAFQQHCYASFDEAKVLPVYIDCRLLGVRSAGGEISLEQLLIIFYKRLIRKVLIDIKRFSEKIITVGMLDRLFGSEGRDRRHSIDASIQSLEQLLDEDVIEESIKSYIYKVENTAGSSRKISGAARLSLRISEKFAGGESRAEGEVRGEKAWKHNEKLETIYNGLAIIDYDKIQSHIISIVRNSGANSVTVLIDEWSDLPRDLQPLIAEMLKKTLGTSPIINLKIAALKYFCRPSATLEDGQPIGLTRANLAILADLDALLRFEAQEQAVKDFLTTMLYKHVVTVQQDLGQKSVAEFESLLCTKLFEGDKAYQELIRASEGNPRDFLELLGNCVKGAELDVGKPITERAVLHAAIDYFQNNKQPEITDKVKLTDAFDKLFHLVTNKKSKLFAISSAIAEQSEVLRELWHYRFIHLLQERIPIFVDDSSRDYDIYTVDYGKLLSLKLTREGEKRFNQIKRVSSIAAAGGGVVPSIFNMLLKHEKTGGAMRKMLGKSAVALEGVERGNFHEIERLITEGCVADEILSPANL